MTVLTYSPDILGGDFVAREIELRSDAIATTDLVATLVRLGEPQQDLAVLYLHGFSDYFFQADHATHLSAEGEVDFYALDLRRYGRSLRPGQDAGDIRDIAEYDEEITAALEVVRSEGHARVVLLGHSTGGLIATMYAHRHPDSIEALVLNSPWYDINSSAMRRYSSGPLSTLVARRAPMRPMSSLGREYGSSIHRSTGGEWDFDLTWKPLEGFPVRAAWLAAIRRAQRELAGGLELAMPTLMCTSSRSGGTHGRRPTPEQLLDTDTVLDVEHMWRAVPRLGRDVTLRTIPGGRHDLALSQAEARAEYEHVVLDWLARRLD